MTNLDYWQKFVGEESPEDFLRNHGTADPELGVARFLEDRNHLYGVVNQGQWRDTFETPEQYQRLTVQVYLLSYLEETRQDWAPALEAKPPSIPRRYREKFNQDKYPPPPQEPVDSAGSANSGNREVDNESNESGQPVAPAAQPPAATDVDPLSAEPGAADPVANDATSDTKPVHEHSNGDASETPTGEAPEDRQE